MKVTTLPYTVPAEVVAKARKAYVVPGSSPVALSLNAPRLFDGLVSTVTPVPPRAGVGLTPYVTNDPTELDAVRPWRSYAVMHLWNHLFDPIAKEAS